MDEDDETVLLDEKDFIVNRIDSLRLDIRKLMNSDDFLFNKMTFKNILNRDRKLQSDVFYTKSGYAAKLQLDFKNANSKEDLLYTRKIESLTVVRFTRELIYRQLEKSTIELFYNRHEEEVLEYTAKRIADATNIVEKRLSEMEKKLLDYWSENSANDSIKIYYNFINDFLICFTTEYIVQAVHASKSPSQMGLINYIVQEKYMTLDKGERKSKSTINILVFLIDFLVIRDFMVLIESKTLLIEIVHCIEALIYNKMSFPFFDMITRILYGNGNEVKSKNVVVSMLDDKHFLNVNIKDKRANESIEQANTEQIIDKSILGRVVKYNKFSVIEKALIDSRNAVVVKNASTMTDIIDGCCGGGGDDDDESIEKFNTFLQEKIRCNVCMGSVKIKELYILSCTHYYCFDCIPNLTNPTCPECRTPIKWGSILTFKERFNIHSYITFDDVKIYISSLASNKNIQPFSTFEDFINKIYNSGVLNASSNVQPVLPPSTSSSSSSSAARTLPISNVTPRRTAAAAATQSPTTYYLSRTQRIYNVDGLIVNNGEEQSTNTPTRVPLPPIAAPRRSLERLQRNINNNVRRILYPETNSPAIPSTSAPTPTPPITITPSSQTSTNRLERLVESRNAINQQRQREAEEERINAAHHEQTVQQQQQQRQPSNDILDPAFFVRTAQRQVIYDATHMLRTHDVGLMLENLFPQTIPSHLPNLYERINSMSGYYDEWFLMRNTCRNQIDEILKRKHRDEDVLRAELDIQLNLLGLPTAETAIRRTDLMARHRHNLELIENRFKENYDQIFGNFDRLSLILYHRIESLFY
jgi:hypothetical protein